MRIEERIAESSREHYALFALDRYSDHEGTPVYAGRLHEATGEFFPDERDLLDSLMELATRNLTENTPDGWQLTNPGKTAIKRRGMPDYPAPWSEPEPTNLADEADGDEGEWDIPESELIPPVNDWEATDVEGLYVARRMPADAQGTAMPDLLHVGERIRDALPDDELDRWNVVLTEGPWRFHDVAYAVVEHEGAILLDAYSVRPNVAPHAYRVVRSVLEEVLDVRKWEDETARD